MGHAATRLGISADDFLVWEAGEALRHVDGVNQHGR